MVSLVNLNSTLVYWFSILVIGLMAFGWVQKISYEIPRRGKITMEHGVCVWVLSCSKLDGEECFFENKVNWHYSITFPQNPARCCKMPCCGHLKCLPVFGGLPFQCGHHWCGLQPFRGQGKCFVARPSKKHGSNALCSHGVWLNNRFSRYRYQWCKYEWSIASKGMQWYHDVASILHSLATNWCWGWRLRLLWTVLHWQ